MVKGNVIYLNVARRFTRHQKKMIKVYVETYDEILKSKADVTYGRSELGEEYCTVMNGEKVVCHIAKIGRHYITDCITTGFRKGPTLECVLITPETPRLVVDLFENKRKASA